MPVFCDKPLGLFHQECQSSWDMYSIEMPPRISICTNCRQALKLVRHDPTVNAFIYRNIK